MIAAVAAGLTLPGIAIAQEPEQVQLRPIPAIPLQGVDPTVRETLTNLRINLEVLSSADPIDTEQLAEAFGQLGRAAYAYLLWDVAEASLINARLLALDDFRWSYLLGTLYQTQQDLDAAAAALDDTLVIQPGAPAATLRRAQVHLEQGELTEAEALFSEVLAFQRWTAAAHYGMGRVAAARGDGERAIESYRLCLEHQATARECHQQLGLAYRDTGDLERAREHLSASPTQPLWWGDQLIRRLSSDFPQSSLVAGREAFRAGDFAAAAEHYRKAAADSPEDPVPRRLLAVALLALDRPEEAAASAREALAMAPRAAINLQTLAAALRAIDPASEEALGLFEQALGLDPRLAEAHLGLASVHAARQELDPALQHFRRAADLAPENSLAQLGVADVLLAQGQTGDAIEVYESVVARHPTEFDARVRLGLALGNAGRYDEAAVNFGEALALRPDSEDLYLLRSRALGSAGRFGESLECLEGGRTRLPESDVLTRALARALATLPEASLRDGARALELAGPLLRRSPSPENAETMAAAFAAAGQLDNAIALQQRLISESVQHNQGDETRARLAANLERFQRGEPAEF